MRWDEKVRAFKTMNTEWGWTFFSLFLFCFNQFVYEIVTKASDTKRLIESLFFNYESSLLNVMKGLSSWKFRVSERDITPKLNGERQGRFYYILSLTDLHWPYRYLFFFHKISEPYILTITIRWKLSSYILFFFKSFIFLLFDFCRFRFTFSFLFFFSCNISRLFSFFSLFIPHFFIFNPIFLFIFSYINIINRYWLEKGLNFLKKSQSISMNLYTSNWYAFVVILKVHKQHQPYNLFNSTVLTKVRRFL